jgi:Ca-activated chloride channel family protein
MYDGLRVGEARVAEAPSTHTIRRVVLISDGMANIGPSSPEELGNLAAQGTETGAQVSAIGVGLEYDENTLGALAMRSAGRLYHLSQPSEMASILREELQRLSNTVATDAYIEVDPASGVEILGSENAPMQNQGGHVRVQLGTLTGGQHREILLRARVDTSHAGDHALANARLVFHDASGAHAEHAQLVPLSYAVTGDAAAARRSVDGRVQAMVASNDAAQAQLRAVRMMNQGQTAAAAQVLQQAEQQLAVAAAAAPADERERITRQAGHMHHSAAAAGRAATPSAARSGALEINADAYHDMGM